MPTPAQLKLIMKQKNITLDQALSDLGLNRTSLNNLFVKNYIKLVNYISNL